MKLLDDFKNLVEAIEAEGIEYATCGGLAMAVHGFVRATKDIDILINERDVEKVFAIARKFEYDIEGLPLNFDGGKMRLRRISKIDQETKTLITLDCLIVTDFMKDVWDTRELFEWASGRAWVVSRDGLIKMKTLAGRDQDKVDIQKLRGDDDAR